jgi:hypothetical protein
VFRSVELSDFTPEQQSAIFGAIHQANSGRRVDADRLSSIGLLIPSEPKIELRKATRDHQDAKEPQKEPVTSDSTKTSNGNSVSFDEIERSFRIQIEELEKSSNKTDSARAAKVRLSYAVALNSYGHQHDAPHRRAQALEVFRSVELSDFTPEQQSAIFGAIHQANSGRRVDADLLSSIDLVDLGRKPKPEK